MRRRDATDFSSFLHSDRRRSAWSTAVSVAIHAVLLAVAVRIIVSGGAAERLIQVSLIPGGGTGSAAGGNSGSAAPPALGPPAPDLPPVAAAHAPGAQLLRKAPLPNKGRAAHRRLAAPEEARRPAADAANAAANDGEQGQRGAGEGEGAGLGNGAGTGVGGGSGGGAGMGVGGGDQRAHCVYCPEPQYPTVAQRRGWEGTVRVGLSVLADGTVEEVSLRQSSGYNVLDRAAVEVARQSRFTPPGSIGLAVPLHGRIDYRFELSNLH
jgi:protein TonB